MVEYSDIAGTKRQQYERLKAELSLERTSFDSVWRDLDTYIWPGRSRFQITDRNKGQRRDQKIINSHATHCAEILQAGMQSGNTDPSSEWLKLALSDSDLSENSSVQQWLHDVTLRLLALFQRSNLYNILPVVYGDMGVFGTGCMSLLHDPVNGLRAQAYPIGSYLLGVDSSGKVNTFIRDYRMTVRQIVSDYVWDPERKTLDWSKVSTSLKNAWDKNNKETLIDVCWIITPNLDADPEKLNAKYLPWSSCHYEVGTNEDGKFLRESGFRQFPIIAARWHVGAEETYGTDCPGRKALGHTKSLQLKERRLAQAIEKLVSPPLQAPTHLINQKVSGLPGDVSYADQVQQNSGIRPIYQIDPRVREMFESINDTKSLIDDCFFRPLFLMFDSIDRDATATEILERKQEKILTLGPVSERVKTDMLDPIVDIGFAALEATGDLPEIPQELEGRPLKVEYLGVFAQAQRAAGVTKLSRFVAELLPIAQIDPIVVTSKVNFDNVIDGFATLGINPNCIRSDEDAAQYRQALEQQMEEARQAELAAQTAAAGKQLSETSMEGNTALNRILEGARP